MKRIMKRTHACLPLLLLAAGAALWAGGCAGTPTRESTGEYIDDTALTAKVKTALIRDSTVKARQVDVTSFKGVVQLSGFVDTVEQKDRAGQIAVGIAGVREVRNNILVK